MIKYRTLDEEATRFAVTNPDGSVTSFNTNHPDYRIMVDQMNQGKAELAAYVPPAK